jgi:hypothetical protein
MARTFCERVTWGVYVQTVEFLCSDGFVCKAVNLGLGGEGWANEKRRTLLRLEIVKVLVCLQLRLISNFLDVLRLEICGERLDFRKEG